MLPRDHDPDDPVGLRRDVLSDGMMDLSLVTHNLSKINVFLDEIAEAPAVLTDDELAEVRSLQRSVQALYQEKKTDYEETQAAFADVVDEIDGMK